MKVDLKIYITCPRCQLVELRQQHDPAWSQCWTINCSLFTHHNTELPMTTWRTHFEGQLWKGIGQFTVFPPQYLHWASICNSCRCLQYACCFPLSSQKPSLGIAQGLSHFSSINITYFKYTSGRSWKDSYVNCQDMEIFKGELCSLAQ